MLNKLDQCFLLTKWSRKIKQRIYEREEFKEKKWKGNEIKRMKRMKKNKEIDEKNKLLQNNKRNKIRKEK